MPQVNGNQCVVHLVMIVLIQAELVLSEDHTEVAIHITNKCLSLELG